MSLFDWFHTEEGKIAADLAPLIADIKADLAAAGHTLGTFLAQDGAAIFTGAVSTLTAAASGGASVTAEAVGAAISGAFLAVKATAVKQGVNLATTTAMAIAANITAQANDHVSGTAVTANTNTSN